MSEAQRVRPRDTVLWREFDDATIILDAATGRYFELDAAGGTIWRSIAAERPFEHHEDAAHELFEAANASQLVEPASTPRPLDAGSASPSGLQITRGALTGTESVAALRDAFGQQRHVRLPQFINPSLLDLLERQ